MKTMLSFALPHDKKIRISTNIKDYSYFKKSDYA